MSDSDQIRDEFEALAKANDLPTAVLHSGKNSGYVDVRTAWAFEGYRAGRKAEREAIQRKNEEWSKAVNKAWIDTANEREGE